jgi:hypothetical protein
MAEGFLGGLLGGIGDAAQGVGSGLAGLLGGGQPSSGQSQDPYAQMSPEEQRRMNYSALGQLGAILLAAGQKQSPAQRGQILSQLGNIGPGMEQQIARSAALRGQQAEAAQRRELFPLQKQQLEGTLAQQQLSQQQAQQQMAAARQTQALQLMKLQQDIKFLESQGLDASGPRSQLQIIQGLGAGVPGAPAAPSQRSGYVPSQAVAGTAVVEPGFTSGEVGGAVPTPQQAQSGAQSVLSQLPYLSGPVVMAAFQQSSDPAKTMADLQAQNEKAKQEQFKFEGELRKEYMPRAEKFADIQTTFKSMGTLAKQANGASDIMLITQLYKLYDPTSVVSTNETGQIKVTGGVENRFQGIVNQFNGEGILTDKVRQEILDTGMAKFTDAYVDHSKLYSDANKRASGMGVDLSRAVPDVKDPELSSYMDMLTVKKMPAKKSVEIGDQKYEARLGIDGSYYVNTPNGRRKINIGE